MNLTHFLTRPRRTEVSPVAGKQERHRGHYTEEHPMREILDEIAGLLRRIDSLLERLPLSSLWTLFPRSARLGSRGLRGQTRHVLGEATENRQAADLLLSLRSKL